MKRLTIAGMTLLAGCAAPQPAGPPQPPRELAGRTAGAPQNCVLIRPSELMRISDTSGHVLLYGSGATIWAVDLGPGCGFTRSDVLITNPSGSYYCRGDLVRSIDQVSRIPGPTCVLGDFVPYTR